MIEFDTKDILSRIGDHPLPGRSHSVLLTFRKSDGTAHPIGWCPVADLDVKRSLAVRHIAHAGREMARESVSGSEEAFAEVKAYVIGLSDDLRPTSWDPEIMDDYDHEYFDSTLRNAIRNCLGDNDAFRVASSLCRNLMISADEGIIPVAHGLIRRMAEAMSRPYIMDHAAEMLCVELTMNSQWLTKVTYDFMDRQRESQAAPSP